MIHANMFGWLVVLYTLAATSDAAGATGPAPTRITVAGIAPETSEGRGAAVAFAEYEAENAATDGTRTGPDRRFTTIAAEASGRRAVRLDRRGQYVEFTLARPANALTARVAIPDGPDGIGIDARLEVLAGGAPLGHLDVTSRYGWYYGAYPFTNRPADGRPHHVFDEARLLLGRTLPAGTRVRLRVPADAKAAWYVVDLADFEQVPPPLPRPAGALSVTDFGADPTGRKPSAQAFRRGIAAASAHAVALWIPPGTFRVEEHLVVDRVTIAGAGAWHTVVRGKGVGFYGRPAPGGSAGVTLRDFAILGEVTERIDDAQANAIGGAMGGGSVIANLWIQHHKAGLWFDGPMSGIRISGLRVLDCTADGLNFRRGVSDAVVENSFWRNTGDDALAAWSHRDANHHIAFRRNTVIAPVLANGIAIYGGHDIEVSGNLVADTLTEGGGLHLGNRFDAVPASGRIAFLDNMVVRGGSFDPNWRFGVGALWFYALDAPIAAQIEVRDTVLLDSSEEAVQLLGKRIDSVVFDGLTVRGGAAALQLQSPGSATLVRGTARDLRGPAVLRCDPEFALRVADSKGFAPVTAKGCPP